MQWTAVRTGASLSALRPKWESSGFTPPHPGLGLEIAISTSLEGADNIWQYCLSLSRLTSRTSEATAVTERLDTTLDKWLLPRLSINSFLGWILTSYKHKLVYTSFTNLHEPSLHPRVSSSGHRSVSYLLLGNPMTTNQHNDVMAMNSHLHGIGSPIAADSQYTSSDEEDGDVMSLTPSITNYPMQWGRRYHKFREGKYLLPNDDMESNRLDFQHAILKALHGDRFFLSPVKDPRKILDIGTGTGIWAVELADSEVVPNARITGTDLSPIQPSDVPENVSFEIADCTEPDWYRPKDSVDLIFARMMLSSIASYPSFMSTAKVYLRPGTGWLECQDIDPRPRSDDATIPPNWPLTQWDEKMNKGLEKIHESLTMHAAPKLKRWMEDAGYVDVHEVIHKIPVGSWPKNGYLKRIGRAWAELLYDGLPAFSYKILGPEGLGMSRTEIEVFLADVRKSVNDRNVHYYFNYHTVCGRRPGMGEEMQEQMVSPAAANLPSPVSAQ